MMALAELEGTTDNFSTITGACFDRCLERMNDKGNTIEKGSVAWRVVLLFAIEYFVGYDYASSEEQFQMIIIMMTIHRIVSRGIAMCRSM